MAGAGALKTIGSYNEQSAATDAYNAGQDAQYGYRIGEYNAAVKRGMNRWNERLAIRGANERNFQRTRQAVGQAFSDAMYDNQLQLDQTLASSIGSSLEAKLNLMKANAANSARGRQGKRAGLSNVANYQAFGREQANRADDLALAINQSALTGERIARQANNDIMNAYYRSGLGIQMQAPVFGPPPVHGGYRSGPSRLSLYGGLLGNVISGVGAYNQAAAPQDRIGWRGGNVGQQQGGTA